MKSTRPAHRMTVGKHLPDESGVLLGAAPSVGVEEVEGISLDDGDEPGGIVGIGGIAAPSQAVGPAGIVGDRQLEERRIALAQKETGMVVETFGWLP